MDFIENNAMSFKVLICLTVPLFLVMWEAIITRRLMAFNEQKNEWIEKWENFRDNNG